MLQHNLLKHEKVIMLLMHTHNIQRPLLQLFFALVTRDCNLHTEQ